jgi:hypothetical protein
MVHASLGQAVAKRKGFPPYPRARRRVWGAIMPAAGHADTLGAMRTVWLPARARGSGFMP